MMRRPETQAGDYGTNVVYAGADYPVAYIVNVVTRGGLRGTRVDLDEIVHRIPLGASLNRERFPALVCGLLHPGVTPERPARLLLFDGLSAQERLSLCNDSHPLEIESDDEDAVNEEDDDDDNDDDNDDNDDDDDEGDESDDDDNPRPKKRAKTAANSSTKKKVAAAEVKPKKSVDREVTSIVDKETARAERAALREALRELESNEPQHRTALCTVNGVVSPEHALLVMWLQALTLSRHGVPCTIVGFRVFNIVSTLALNLGSIDPDRLAQKLGSSVNYNPLRINMVRVENRELGLVFLVWPSDGCVVISKATTREQIADGVRWLYTQCRECVSLEGHMTSDDLRRKHAERIGRRSLAAAAAEPMHAQTQLLQLQRELLSHQPPTPPPPLLSLPQPSAGDTAAENPLASRLLEGISTSEIISRVMRTLDFQPSS